MAGMQGAHSLLATYPPGTFRAPWSTLRATWGTLKFHFLGVLAGPVIVFRFLLMASHPHRAWFHEENTHIWGPLL